MYQKKVSFYCHITCQINRFSIEKWNVLLCLYIVIERSGSVSHFLAKHFRNWNFYLPKHLKCTHTHTHIAHIPRAVNRPRIDLYFIFILYFFFVREYPGKLSLVYCLVEQNSIEHTKSLKFTILVYKQTKSAKLFEMIIFYCSHWISRWKGHWKVFCNHHPHPTSLGTYMETINDYTIYIPYVECLLHIEQLKALCIAICSTTMYTSVAVGFVSVSVRKAAFPYNFQFAIIFWLDTMLDNPCRTIRKQ